MGLISDRRIYQFSMVGTGLLSGSISRPAFTGASFRSPSSTRRWVSRPPLPAAPPGSRAHLVSLRGCRARAAAPQRSGQAGAALPARRGGARAASGCSAAGRSPACSSLSPPAVAAAVAQLTAFFLSRLPQLYNNSLPCRTARFSSPR